MSVKMGRVGEIVTGVAAMLAGMFEFLLVDDVQPMSRIESNRKG
jgi:hypothetical protein